MYKKKGFPEVNEFIMCSITRLTPYSAFVELVEYENLEGMIHTSEMTRRIVRNMKTILKIGKTVVCKVMDVDQEKRHINLSLRWVGISQERTKLIEWKNEKRADDLLQVFAKMNKIKIEQVYKKIGNKFLDKYSVLYPAFEEIARGDLSIVKNLKIEPKLESKFLELLKNRITISKAEIRGNLILKSEASNGLEIVKAAFKSAKEFASKNNADFEAKYIGAPKYQIKLSTDDKKKLSQLLDQMIEMLEKELSKNKGTVAFAKA